MPDQDQAKLESRRTRLSEAREELVRADAKASTLLASEGVVAGVILAALIAGDWSPASLPPCAGVSWWVGVCCGLGSLVALGVAIYPRTRAKRERSLSGPAFFGDSTRTSGDRTLAESKRLKDQLAQIARIARVKYRAIKVAIWLVAAAVGFLLLATLLDIA